jgi:hypothetical protein
VSHACLVHTKLDMDKPTVPSAGEERIRQGWVRMHLMPARFALPGHIRQDMVKFHWWIAPSAGQGHIKLDSDRARLETALSARLGCIRPALASVCRINAVPALKGHIRLGWARLHFSAACCVNQELIRRDIRLQIVRSARQGRFRRAPARVFARSAHQGLIRRDMVKTHPQIARSARQGPT